MSGKPSVFFKGLLGSKYSTMSFPFVTLSCCVLICTFTVNPHRGRGCNFIAGLWWSAWRQKTSSQFNKAIGQMNSNEMRLLIATGMYIAQLGDTETGALWRFLALWLLKCGNIVEHFSVCRNLFFCPGNNHFLCHRKAQERLLILLSHFYIFKSKFSNRKHFHNNNY